MKPAGFCLKIMLSVTISSSSIEHLARSAGIGRPIKVSKICATCVLVCLLYTSRHFLAVARTGTLSAAAEMLGTDHTTVARHIQRLEERLATRIFYRSNLGYDLTASGEQLRPIAETMEASYLQAASMENENPTVSGTIRIGAPDGFGTGFLAPRIHKLAALHPKLEIELLATARVFSLSKREADIGISLTSPEHARVVSRRLIDYRLHIYASRAYLTAHPPIASPADLTHHDFVGYIEDMLFTPELNYLSSVGPGINARIRSTNLTACLLYTSRCV